MTSRHSDAWDSPGFLLWHATLRWQRTMVEAQLLQRLGDFVLQFELCLQIRGRRHFRRSRRRAFQPRSDRAVGELRFVANDGPIYIA